MLELVEGARGIYHMKHYRCLLCLCFVAVYLLLRVNGVPAAEAAVSGAYIPIAGDIEIDKNGVIARNSVVKVFCQNANSFGSGFTHKSGRIITVQHVVHGCSEVLVVSLSGITSKSKVVASDITTDLALLNPESPLPGPSLDISQTQRLKYGTVVSTWGFPSGYGGAIPLLSVGYFSGSDVVKKVDQRLIRQFLINAAFNSGNSGGPLLDVLTGEVIGVVASKLAPISEKAKSALEALSNQKSGFMYEAKRADGSTVQFSEGQVVALVLEELRKQVQLVIGAAVVLEDLRAFLRAQGIDP